MQKLLLDIEKPYEEFRRTYFSMSDSSAVEEGIVTGLIIEVIRKGLKFKVDAVIKIAVKMSRSEKDAAILIEALNHLIMEMQLVVQQMQLANVSEITYLAFKEGLLLVEIP